MSKAVHATLIQAAVNGDIADMATHIANGANPNAIYEAAPGKYVSTLTLTASAGPALAVQALLTSGASPDGDPRGGSPLEAAMTKGRADVVAVLLKFGADPNRRNERGDTPLHMAAHLEQDQIYRLLVEKGADQNAKDKKGLTPLQIKGFVTASGSARR
jgi:ankyrin repeat protein